MRKVVHYTKVSWAEGESTRGMDFEAIIKGRRSVRWFEERELPQELIAQILEAGRWAPSPHGRQPWRFVVLTRREARQRLAEAMGETWTHQLALDGQDAATVALRREKSQARVVAAPLAVILCLYLEDLDQYPDPERQTHETAMAVQSLGAAAQNMLLAAYALGADGGWMCAPLFCPEVVCAALGLPSTLIPHALLTFGYAARAPVRRERLPLDQLVVHFD
jgi:coenzyme F420-0:L-glutamate ligase / coenzyme F420-1:gamma-L-glutamate ligase